MWLVLPPIHIPAPTPPPVCPCTTDILKHDVFGPFYDIFPEKFQNKTNGCVLVGAWLLSICVQPAC